MKSLTLLVLLAVPASCPAMAESSCSTNEKALFELVTRQFQTGAPESGPLVVGEAHLNYLQAQLACKEISRSTFCKDAMDVARANIRVSINQMTAGTTSPTQAIHLQREFREITAYCK